MSSKDMSDVGNVWIALMLHQRSLDPGKRVSPMSPAAAANSRPAGVVAHKGVAARFLPYNPAKTRTNIRYGASQMLHQLPAAENGATPPPAAPQSPNRVRCNPVIEQMVTAR